MESSSYCIPIITLFASVGRGHYNVVIGSQFQYVFFRSSWGWGPHSLSTSLLIFRSPRSIYSYFAWIRYSLSDYCSLFRKGQQIWVAGDDFCNKGNRIIGFRGMGSPYIYGWDGCRHAGLFYRRYDNYCCAYGYQNFFVIGKFIWVTLPIDAYHGVNYRIPF